MVTWGQNTVHTFGAPAAPAPSGSMFGSTSAPAPTGLFGAPTPAPASGALFGTPAPAPSSGGLFGMSSPAPAPGGSLFGAPSPAPSGFGFGAPPAPAFGTPSAFGTSSSLFGNTSTTQQQQQQQQQIPAQAALQAHMDASARQEAERVRSALERLHVAYSGGASGTNSESKFVAIVYNDVTPEQRQQHWIHGMGRGGYVRAPPPPAGVSEKEWQNAVVNNPDPENYMPMALVGGVALQARVSWQQDSAKKLAENAAILQKSLTTIKDRATRAKQDIEEKARRHAVLRKRLLDLMRRVELARCMNQHIQEDEIKAIQRLRKILQEVDSAKGSLTSLQDKARTQTAAVARSMEAVGIPDKTILLNVLKEQRHKLENLTLTTKRDLRDVRLIQERTIVKVPALSTR
jgi:nuclear pore complex protein Nup54